jgi:hypothetical protein
MSLEKRHWFGLLAIIRRGAWTLPAAGLLLGAPWIKPYFASTADAAVETASWPPFRANDLDTWARIATSDSYQLFSLTQVLETPARIPVVMSVRLHRLLGRSEGRRK